MFTAVKKVTFLGFLLAPKEFLKLNILVFLTIYAGFFVGISDVYPQINNVSLNNNPVPVNRPIIEYRFSNIRPVSRIRDFFDKSTQIESKSVLSSKSIDQDKIRKLQDEIALINISDSEFERFSENISSLSLSKSKLLSQELGFEFYQAITQAKKILSRVDNQEKLSLSELDKINELKSYALSLYLYAVVLSEKVRLTYWDVREKALKVIDNETHVITPAHSLGISAGVITYNLLSSPQACAFLGAVAGCVLEPTGFYSTFLASTGIAGLAWIAKDPKVKLVVSIIVGSVLSPVFREIAVQRYIKKNPNIPNSDLEVLSSFFSKWPNFKSTLKDEPTKETDSLIISELRQLNTSYLCSEFLKSKNKEKL